MVNCENCGNEHNGEYGSGRFCSIKCARGFSTKVDRSLINKKISAKLKGSGHSNIKLICKECNKEFSIDWNKRNQQYCSRSCAGKLKGDWNRAHSRLSSEDWSIINKKSYSDGRNTVGGGITKWYIYNGIKLQGTYELRTSKILEYWKVKKIIHNWEYTNDRINYIGIDGNKHSYLLDFKVYNLNGSFYYIETKGFEKPNDKLKWKAVRDKGFILEIWFNEDISKYELQISINV